MLSLPMASEFIFVFSQVCIDMLPAHAQMMLSLGRSCRVYLSKVSENRT